MKIDDEVISKIKKQIRIKPFFKKAIIVACVALLLIACGKNKEISNPQTLHQKLSSPDLGYLMIFPQGTQYEYVMHQESGDSDVRFFLPEN